MIGSVLVCSVAALAALPIILNWLGVIAHLLSRKAESRQRAYSFALPFICGPILAATWGFCRTFPFRRYAWVAIFADPSILLPTLAFTLGGFRKLLHLAKQRR